MIGSDHAERIKEVASHKTSFNLGGDLAFILTRKILLKTKDRLDLGLDECVQIGQEAVMEAEFFRAVSLIFPFREGHDCTPAVRAWAGYIASLHFINLEMLRGVQSVTDCKDPSQEQVRQIQDFIDQEFHEDQGETEAVMKKLATELRSAFNPTES
jgi:hypothetical protein